MASMKTNKQTKNNFHTIVTCKFVFYFEYKDMWPSGAQAVEGKHITKEILQLTAWNMKKHLDSHIVYKSSLTTLSFMNVFKIRDQKENWIM